MKKFLFLLSALVAMATMISCGKDNAGGAGSGDASKPVSTKVVATVVVELNNDYFLYADYNVYISKNGQVVYDQKLSAPGANKRTELARTYDFEDEGTLTVNVVPTRNEVPFETAMTTGTKQYEYVVFNTNHRVGIDFKDFDASGKQVYNTYGTMLKAENTNQGVVDDTHGFGAAELNSASLSTALDTIEDNGKTVFENRNLKGYSIKYQIVKTEEGLTAKSIE